MNAQLRVVQSQLRALDAEQALIGATLYDPSLWNEAVDLAYFTEPGHRWLWENIGYLQAEGATGPELLPLLISRAAAVQNVQDLGGTGYLVDLFDKAPTGVDLQRFASELGAAWIMRMRSKLTEGDGEISRPHLDWLYEQADILDAKWSGRPSTKLAQPFTWREPSSLPLRDFLYGQHYIRRFLSTTVAPGGLGKSSLTIAEALAMASGKALLKVALKGRLKVWLWNGEDPLEETERRVHATMLHYGLAAADVESFLFLGSGREAEIIMAEQGRDGVIVQRPRVQALKDVIARHHIDVVVIDPFVSSHRVQENDNNAVDRVAKTWAGIAEECNVAVELVHHVRKSGAPGQEITVEDGRGAVALLAAARSARVLNPMTKEQAEKVEIDRPRSYFRVDNGKANMAPPPDGATWYRFVSVSLGNGGLEGGDSVGVVEPWTMPNPLDDVTVQHLREVQRRILEGSWRESVQAKSWAGLAVVDVLGLDPTCKAHRAKAGQLLKTWIKNGALKVDRRADENGDERPFIVSGPPV